MKYLAQVTLLTKKTTFVQCLMRLLDIIQYFNNIAWGEEMINTDMED